MLRIGASAAARIARGPRAGAPAEPAGSSPGTASRSALRSAVRSIAAAAPLRRVPRRRFPDLPFSANQASDPPGRASGSHPTQRAAKGRMRARGLPSAYPFGDFVRLRPPPSCWTECMLREVASIPLELFEFLLPGFAGHTARTAGAYGDSHGRTRPARSVQPQFAGANPTGFARRVRSVPQRPDISAPRSGYQ